MKLTPINLNTTPRISFKSEADSTKKDTSSKILNTTATTDTFEKTTAQPTGTTQADTVSKVLTSFKKMFAPQQAQSGQLSDNEITDMIFSRNLLL